MVELLDDSERCAKLGRNALNKFCSDWNIEVVEMNLVRFYNEIKQNIESVDYVGC